MFPLPKIVPFLSRTNILYAKPEASVEDVMRAAALADIHEQVPIQLNLYLLVFTSRYFFNFKFKEKI